MSGTGERVWDGRGDRLSDARLFTGCGRAADDLRLTGLHLRLLIHLGRQNSRRGWVLISQKELAERWGVSRQRVCMAINDLVDWKYLRKRSQAERGESFCVYKVLLDDDEDGEEGVSPVGDTGVTQEVTRVSPSIGHSTDKTDKTDSPLSPPEGGARGGEPPDEGQGKPSARRRRDRAAETDAMLRRLAAHAGRTRVVETIIGPLCRQLSCDAPDPEFALGLLADWLAERDIGEADARRIAERVTAKRRATFKPADVQAAAKALLPTADGQVPINRKEHPEAVRAWIAHAEGRPEREMRAIAHLLRQHGMAVVPTKFPPAKEVKAA